MPAVGAAWLHETDVRAMCLVRACETGLPDAALWSPEDAAWASRLADETLPADAPPAAWLAARARHAVQRIVPRRASLAQAYRQRAFAARGLGLAVLGGFVLGLATDLLGAGQQLQLLATPLWVVVGWNLAVYLWLAVAAARSAPAGGLRRIVERALGGGKAARDRLADFVAGADRNAETSGTARTVGMAGSTRGPEQRFLALWTAAAAPLMASRAAVLLHVAAAMLALGLLAGMYLRALGFDYRVGWQSTLLTPLQVHGLLAALLAPASALTGIAVPGVDAVAALRTDAAGAPLTGGAPAPAAALPWLHLWAATLGWAVLVPRLMLALHAAWCERLRARRVPWPLADAYSRRVLDSRRNGVAARAVVIVLPHGMAPAPAAVLALRTVLADGEAQAAHLQVAAPTAYGDEEQAAQRLATAVPAAAAAAPSWPAAPSSPARPAPAQAWSLPPACLAWFDLAATPEPQVQGRFVAELRPAVRGPFALLVDESGYRLRLGAASPRLAERRRAWQALADEAGVGLASIDLLAAGAGPAQAKAALGVIEAAWAATTPTAKPAGLIGEAAMSAATSTVATKVTPTVATTAPPRGAP